MGLRVLIQETSTSGKRDTRAVIASHAVDSDSDHEKVWYTATKTQRVLVTTKTKARGYNNGSTGPWLNNTN